MASTYPGGNESPRYDSNFVTRPGFGSAQYRPSWQRQHPPVYIGQVTAQPDDALPVYTVKEQCHNGNLTEFVDGRELSATEMNGNITVPVGTYVVIEHMEGPTGFGAYFAFAEGGIVPAEGITVGFWSVAGGSVQSWYPITSIIFGKDDPHANVYGYGNWDATTHSATTAYPIVNVPVVKVTRSYSTTGGFDTEVAVSSGASRLFFKNNSLFAFTLSQATDPDQTATTKWKHNDRVQIEVQPNAPMLVDAKLEWDAAAKKMHIRRYWSDGSNTLDDGVSFVNCITGT